MLNIHGKTCIHEPNADTVCCKPAVHRTHGLLCDTHYRQQQNSIPPKPRLPQGKWLGLAAAKLESDDEIIASIIATDATAIALGRVVVVRRGNVDPALLKILEPAQVNA